MRSAAQPRIEAPAGLIALSPDGVYAALGSSPSGHSDGEAAELLLTYGPNKIEEMAKSPLVARFFSQFVRFFAILLWAAAVLAFVSGTTGLGWALIAVVLTSAVFSFWREHRLRVSPHYADRLLAAASSRVWHCAVEPRRLGFAVRVCPCHIAGGGDAQVDRAPAKSRGVNGLSSG